MRRRLTYANVMATLAFFFALTGASFAGVKYLSASDPITQGDLSGSTYGSPVIAAGKITTSKFDSSATAPNAALLSGHAASDFLNVVSRGELTANGTFTLDPGGCEALTAPLPAGVDRTTDSVIVLRTASSLFFLQVNGGFTFDESSQQWQVELDVCNTTTFAVADSDTYRYVIVR